MHTHTSLPQYWTSPRKILVIGSSISIQKKGYLPFLKSILLDQTKQGHSFFNASLGGTPTVASLAYITGDLFFEAKAFGAEIALIEKAPNERTLSRNPSSLEIASKISEIKASTISLLKILLETGVKPVLLCSYFKPNSTYNWDPNSANSLIHQAYKQISSEHSIPLIDFGGFLSQKIDKSEASESDILLDDCHLTEEGAQFMGNYIAESLLSARCTQYFEQSKAPRITLDQSDTHWTVPRIITLKPSKTFTTSLASAPYTQLDDNKYIKIETSDPVEMIGIFIISDQHSPWISISAVGSAAPKDILNHSICLFDHMSFFPRISYIDISKRKISGTAFNIKLTESDVDISATLKSYWASKTFNPNEQWAQKRYLAPLLQREESNDCVNAKIVAVVFRSLNQNNPDISFVQTFHDIFMPESSPLTPNLNLSKLGAMPLRPRNMYSDGIASVASISKETHKKNMVRKYIKSAFDPSEPDTMRHHEMLKEGLKLVSHTDPASIMTIGDNLGRDAAFFKKYFPNAFCTASDLDTSHLSGAVADGHLDNVLDIDVEKIPIPDETVDIVVAKESFHHWPRPMLGFYEMLRVAKKCILLIEPNDFIRGDPSFPYLDESCYTDAYEKVGNYKYQISVREILKAAWSLYLPACYVIGFNDPWKTPFSIGEWISEKSRIDAMGMRGKRQFNLFAIAVFKHAAYVPSDQGEPGPKLFLRPANPFKDQ